ncbi:DUF302 domain-containing protein [Roseinatronobacter bogoriensis]|uniref:DUF302 domain-containing protein n=1 Tax=Roseinatronobacter bogoriensis subsp. barguzinensis TaxID=441209 RepID=A0A2K8KDQ0_9RHOB|nr:MULTISPECIES: DUF302 domain-containing protein [Rhodobaca]ATX67562.1 DUF302 domain-containing protein [Rhodobaca barguzinensis]MBB4209089.1 uncharacterized protein (DUF302 family) [Rhodobaca bogoriensis DSM 18756]TDW36383.1 uncharacterized protein (DUF302 family) [Rhodobaca barguzinensis]TDY67489.1 uncharacterized protein (DUF302 family) [Rhodobaca bogoriensis DSM 18756]
MKTTLTGAIVAAMLAMPAWSDGFYTVDVDADFEDVVFNVEMAITNQGLVIDDVSYVGRMLERTKEDVGGEKDLFVDARIFSFCSAPLSREVMEAKLRNIQFCPYNVYVYQSAEEGAPVVVGYREFNEPTMRSINYLLQQIVAEAAGG